MLVGQRGARPSILPVRMPTARCRGAPAREINRPRRDEGDPSSDERAQNRAVCSQARAFPKQRRPCSESALCGESRWNRSTRPVTERAGAGHDPRTPLTRPEPARSRRSAVRQPLHLPPRQADAPGPACDGACQGTGGTVARWGFSVHSPPPPWRFHDLTSTNVPPPLRRQRGGPPHRWSSERTGNWL